MQWNKNQGKYLDNIYIWLYEVILLKFHANISIFKRSELNYVEVVINRGFAYLKIIFRIY